MDDLDEQLLKTCQQGNADEVKLLLDNGANPNCKKIVNGITVYPLWVVGCYPLYQKDDQNISITDIATLEQFNNCAKLLIEKGAKLDNVMISFGDNISHTIRSGLKNMHPTFLEVCENFEELYDPLSVKYAQYE